MCAVKRARSGYDAVARVIGVRVNAVAVPGICQIGDEIVALNELTREIGVAQDHAGVDYGNDHLPRSWCTGRDVPSLWQPDEWVVPLAGVHDIVWHKERAANVVKVGFCHICPCTQRLHSTDGIHLERIPIAYNQARKRAVLIRNAEGALRMRALRPAFMPH